MRGGIERGIHRSNKSRKTARHGIHHELDFFNIDAGDFRRFGIAAHGVDTPAKARPAHDDEKRDIADQRNKDQVVHQPEGERFCLRKLFKGTLKLIGGDPLAVGDQVGSTAKDIGQPQRRDNRDYLAVGDDGTDDQSAERADCHAHEKHHERGGVYALAHQKRRAHA
ncbi:hypothetical protein SDC9_159146 [bioreactor metagenome]|uniref:Uncharacterized protein n=1 Tax=bioreactor metagenome TaxID=1076179 RepID=A0A645FBU9_9ZZZZ